MSLISLGCRYPRIKGLFYLSCNLLVEESIFYLQPLFRTNSDSLASCCNLLWSLHLMHLEFCQLLWTKFWQAQCQRFPPYQGGVEGGEGFADKKCIVPVKGCFHCVLNLPSPCSSKLIILKNTFINRKKNGQYGKHVKNNYVWKYEVVKLTSAS